MQFRVLGTLEVVDDAGAPVDVGGAQPRTVLAVLLLAGGHVVPVDAVVDAVWGEDPPGSAAGTLHTYVSRLRRAIEPDRVRGSQPKLLQWEPPGYRLAVDAADVDFLRFEQLAGRGRALLDAGRLDEARTELLAADALWRGAALLEYADHEFARGVAARLEERRLAALEDRIDADLRLGRHAEAAAELTELADRHPLREGVWGHLALALYRSGRQAEALRALDTARRTLREELGVEPSRPLRELEAQILAHDTALDRADVAPSPATEAPVAGDAPRLVGRRAELAQLVAALDEATSTARMALVEGEPGIGKTRLLEELAVTAHGRGAVVQWGRCHEGGAAPAFWPWLAVLRPLLDAMPDLATPAITPVRDQLLAPAGGSDAPLLVGPVRFQLFEAVAATLAAAAARRPVVVLLDDLQWADQASLELLGFLAGRLVDEPVLVVGTVRELEVGRNDAVVAALAELSRRPGSRRLHLRGLDVHDVGDLLEQATGRSVEPTVAAAIHSRAEGNPFYATELARLLGEDATITDADVPAGVRDVVRQRLARLPDATVDLLRTGAVIGRDVDLGVLTRATDRSFDACLDDLEPAVVHRLLVTVPDRPATFRFSHALVREVVVDSLTSLRRARIHLRVADAIEELAGGADDAAEILAEHLWSAAPIGVGQRAAEALERAADVALRRTAYESADVLLERAVTLRRAGGSTPEEMEAELVSLTRLASVRRALAGYAAVMDLFSQGQELARRCGRQDLYAELVWAEWAGADTACNFGRSEPLVAELERLGAEPGHPLERLAGLGARGIHCWHLGRMREAAEHLDRSADEAKTVLQPLEPLAFAGEFWLLADAFRRYVHGLLADVPDDELDTRFATLANSQPDRFTQSLVWTFGAAWGAAAGDVGRCERYARSALSANADLRFTFWGAQAQMYLGWALLERDDVDEALAVFGEGRTRYEDAGVRTGLGCFLANFAIGLVSCGRLDEAGPLVAEARREHETYGEQWPLPIIVLAEAHLAAARGADATAIAAAVREAVDVAVAHGTNAIARRAVRVAEELGVGPVGVYPAGTDSNASATRA